MGESFAEVLAEFRKAEAPENIIPLLEDEQLRNALVAWKSVHIHYSRASSCEETDDASRWEWLWNVVEFDSVMFGVVAGCKVQEASSLFLRLKGLRLIYPDGTIHGHAKSFLSMMIMERLNRGKRPKKEESKAKGV